MALVAMLPMSLRNLKRAVEEGDLEYSKWVCEMTGGKPRQAQELSGPDGAPVPIRIIEVAIVSPAPEQEEAK